MRKAGNPLGVWSDKLQSYVFGVIHQDTLRYAQRTGAHVSFEPIWPSMPPYALAVHRGLPTAGMDFTSLKAWHNTHVPICIAENEL